DRADWVHKDAAASQHALAASQPLRVWSWNRLLIRVPTRGEVAAPRLNRTGERSVLSLAWSHPTSARWSWGRHRPVRARAFATFTATAPTQSGYPPAPGSPHSRSVDRSGRYARRAWQRHTCAAPRAALPAPRRAQRANALPPGRG